MATIPAMPLPPTPSTGSLVAGRSRNIAGNADMVVWRFNANGTIDTGFDGDGIVVQNNAAGGNADDIGNAIAIDAQGEDPGNREQQQTPRAMPTWCSGGSMRTGPSMRRLTAAASLSTTAPLEAMQTTTENPSPLIHRDGYWSPEQQKQRRQYRHGDLAFCCGRVVAHRLMETALLSTTAPQGAMGMTPAANYDPLPGEGYSSPGAAETARAIPIWWSGGLISTVL